MAKKSSSGHKKPTTAHGKGPAHKQQGPERVNSTATLVRTDGQPGPSSANVVADAAPVVKPQAAPAPKPPVAKTVVAAKPAVKTPAARPAVSAVAPAKTPADTTTAPARAAAPATATATAPARAAAAPRPTTSAREQSMRMARARATQRARTDHIISAENYAYVLGDLKLVVVLAVTAFAVLIALTFILPH